jgi:hypothetical protein
MLEDAQIDRVRTESMNWTLCDHVVGTSNSTDKFTFGSIQSQFHPVCNYKSQKNVISSFTITVELSLSLSLSLYIYIYIYIEGRWVLSTGSFS